MGQQWKNKEFFLFIDHEIICKVTGHYTIERKVSKNKTKKLKNIEERGRRMNENKRITY
jgi:hypothetical protein